MTAVRARDMYGHHEDDRHGAWLPGRRDLRPATPEFLADPYAVLSALPLAAAPVFFAPSIGYYVITSYADVEAVFRDPAAPAGRWPSRCPPTSCSR